MSTWWHEHHHLQQNSSNGRNNFQQNACNPEAIYSTLESVSFWRQYISKFGYYKFIVFQDSWQKIHRCMYLAVLATFHRKQRRLNKLLDEGSVSPCAAVKFTNGVSVGFAILRYKSQDKCFHTAPSSIPTHIWNHAKAREKDAPLHMQSALHSLTKVITLFSAFSVVQFALQILCSKT